MLRRITKCLLMPLLAVCYILFADAPAPVVIAAILFGFAGDVVLLFRPRRWALPAGMFVFAAGHVFYIIHFLGALSNDPAWYIFIISGSVCAVAAITLLRYIRKGLPKKLFIPCLVYMLVIGSMTACSVLFAIYGTAPYRWLAAIGGVLFAVSDATLSIDAFHHPVRHRNIIVMSTYVAAQTLIVSALMFA